MLERARPIEAVKGAKRRDECPLCDIQAFIRIADLRANIVLPLLVMVIALVGFALGLLAVRFLGRVPSETARAFLFHCLVNNYLFLPLPLVLFRYGDHGVALLVFSSVGYELLLWSLGVMLFSRAERKRDQLKSLFSAPFVTLLFSLAVVAAPLIIGALAESRHRDRFSGAAFATSNFGKDPSITIGGAEGGEGLATWLGRNAITEVDVVGIATDYCVRATARDAALEGFETTVLSNLTAAVHPDSFAAVEADLAGDRVAWA